MSDEYGAQVRAQLRNAQQKLADLQQRYDDEHATAVERARETERVRRQLAAAADRIAAVRALPDVPETSRLTPTLDEPSSFDRGWAAAMAAVERALDGPSYAERVNAPPGQATVDALNSALESGDVPVRKVRRGGAAIDGPAEQPADAAELRRQIAALQHRLATVDPDACPRECGEGHTYEPPCAAARPSPKPETPPTAIVRLCRCGHEEVTHAETVCRECVLTGRCALSHHGYVPADGPS